jgi:RNA polymerase sigma-70 factor (ECF subfamily)
MDAQAFARCMARIEAGDAAALDQLLRHACGRLERLARHMLHTHPAVQRWAQTDDVLQGALLRLARALQSVRPANAREFFALAAQQVRRELIDLARHFYGPQGVGANHASTSLSGGGPNDSHDPAALTDWTDLHEQIDALPEEERQVVDLLYYQALPQAEAAAVLGVTVRTVQRRWQSALVRLHRALHDEPPAV